MCPTFLFISVENRNIYLTALHPKSIMKKFTLNIFRKGRFIVREGTEESEIFIHFRLIRFFESKTFTILRSI